MSKNPFAPAIEGALELAEVVVDSKISNEILSDIPFVGLAFKAASAAENYRQYALEKKIHLFCSEPNLRAAIEAKRLREKLLTDEKQDQQIGEMLLMVLDKVTDMTKPVLLAKIFAAYLDEVIEQESLLMLTHVIDISYIGDVLTFINTRKGEFDNSNLWRERLASTGLLETHVSGAIGNAGDIHHEPSPLGLTLYDIIDHYENQQEQQPT